MSQNLIDEALEIRCKKHERPLQLLFANANPLKEEGDGHFEFNSDAFVCPGTTDEDDDCWDDWQITVKVKV